MSVRSETYIMHGILLDVEKTSKFLSKLDEENYALYEKINLPWRGKDAKGKIYIQFDGMGGGYAIAGKVIKVVDHEEGEGFPMTDMSEIISTKTLGDSAELADWMIANGMEELMPGSFSAKTYLFTHYH